MDLKLKVLKPRDTVKNVRVDQEVPRSRSMIFLFIIRYFESRKLNSVNISEKPVIYAIICSTNIAPESLGHSDKAINKLCEVSDMMKLLSS